jgi:hypothetical protein
MTRTRRAFPRSLFFWLQPMGAVRSLSPMIRFALPPLAGGLVLFVLLITPTSSPAQTGAYPPVTNRSFNIDLFEQPALGSPRLIAMSGDQLSR